MNAQTPNAQASNAQASRAQPPTAQTLNESTIRHVLSTTLAALPVDPQRDPEVERAQREATTAALAALRPRDATEAMFAGRAIAAHHAAMECFRRAAQPDVSDEMGTRLLGKAVALSRLAADHIRALEQRQAAATKPDFAGPRPRGTAAVGADAPPAGRRDTMPSEHPAPSDPGASVTRAAGTTNPVSSANYPSRPANGATTAQSATTGLSPGLPPTPGSGGARAA